MTATLDRCELCGRQLHPERITFLVFDQGEPGGYITTEEAERRQFRDDDPNNLGCFPFGSACARKVIDNGGQLPEECRR
jgi:hypothetical protein